MRYAGDNHALRSPNTVQAIEGLARAGHLGSEDADQLTATYVFLRFVEDRLQIVDNRPMSALPTDEVGMDRLTRRLGHADTEAFLAEYEHRTERVREVFEAVFARLQGAD
jgi:glutamate-ammonia-ligase adenylyltransferase